MVAGECDLQQGGIIGFENINLLKMIKLRGNRFGINHTPEEILSILEEIAEKYDLSSRHNQPYYIWDHTTIRRINWFSLPSIKSYLGAWRRQGTPKRLPSTCGAETLRVKNHYLGFYPSSAKLIKIFLDLDAYQKHIEGVERFNDFGFHHIRAPQVYKSAIDPIPHTLEEHIPGKNYLEQPLTFPKELLDELARFHFDRPEIVRIELDKKEKNQIAEVINGFELEKYQSTALFDLLDKGSWQVVLGEVHGDFSPGNLIRGKDRVYITDWEGYTKGPIVQDLVKLYRGAGPELRTRILEVYQDHQDLLDGEGKTDRFGSALFLFTLRLLPSLGSSTLEHLTRVLHEGDQARNKVKNIEASLKDTLLSLLDD